MNISLNWKFIVNADLKTTTEQLDLFANRGMYFWKKLPNQFKNSDRVKDFKTEFDSRNNVKKKTFSGHFGVLSDELLAGI